MDLNDLVYIPRSGGGWTPGWIVFPLKKDLPYKAPEVYVGVMFWHQEGQKWASKGVPLGDIRLEQPEEVRGVGPRRDSLS